MNTYKFRAECIHDVYQFIKLGHAENVNISITTMPDVEVTFESNMDLKSLKRVLAKVVDGHVMRETVAPVELYTGERGGK